MTVPRPEYPRPQFVRSQWLNLNGEWQFEIDHGDSGLERGLLDQELRQRILVPFCPESELSGIGSTDFMLAVWYRRTVEVPASWAGQHVLLHFQAVDYDTTVWVNGVEVGRHRGGFTSFHFDLGQCAGETITIVVRARDDYRPSQPRGKQSQIYANEGCFYTRTTGIWQTVWLEPVPQSFLRRPRITPDVANSFLRLEQPISTVQPGMTLTATVSDKAGVVVSTTVAADLDFTPQLYLALPSERKRLWSPSDPFLYDVKITLKAASGEVVDEIKSYAGLRTITIQGKAIKINGEVIFQRLVLDQGYYPDGIMTAPSEEALIADIELSQAVGFNGARLHQKVFEERFLYHADRLGYLVWGEFADWGFRDRSSKLNNSTPDITYATQWLEAIERDYSHPAIIGWCPLNENIQQTSDRILTHDDAQRALFLAARALDTTRPVLDISGYSHRIPESDVYDSHDYLGSGVFEDQLKQFQERHAQLSEGRPFANPHENTKENWSIPYRGQPYFVSEFGGIWWNPERGMGDTWSSWGYGTPPKSEEEFYYQFQALCDTLLDNPDMFGYCYTQLTDVFIEQNGLYLFDRRPKFDAARLHKIQSRKAKIEQR